MRIPLEAPPRLEGPQWTRSLCSLVAECCVKDPQLRGSADKLLNEHPFIVGCPRRTVISTYVESCWALIRIRQEDSSHMGPLAESLDSLDLSTELALDDLSTCLYMPSHRDAAPSPLIDLEGDGTVVWGEASSAAGAEGQYHKAVAAAAECAPRLPTKSMSPKKKRRDSQSPKSAVNQYLKWGMDRLLAAVAKLELDHKAKLLQVHDRFDARIQALTRVIMEKRKVLNGPGSGEQES
eukprot:TRINITY_DN28861_c0_g1_i2.p1 TRINITY_DN28861_c0_g1~~TRINITY_DN28861_c0_g1_i2.p1  ORF type:complete len:237 (-),score=43.62 TRINITY_DN28861_c0_g1_i2:239-949(-)